MIDSIARIYTINSTSDQTESVSQIPVTLKKYAEELVAENMIRPNHREYIYKEDNVQIRNFIDRLRSTIDNYEQLSMLFTEVCDELAPKLMISQKAQSERYPMVNLKEGNIIFYFSKEGFLISKIDRASYLNGITYEKQVGLPEEKPSQKIAYFQFHENNELSIILSDSNPNISSFWFDSFLELKPLSNNEKNTKTAFLKIDAFINRQVSKFSKADGTELRNNLIGYMRTSDIFSITEAKEYIFGSYIPHSNDLKMDTLKKIFDDRFINNKPVFDTQFQITPEVISARVKKTYKVKDNVELRTNGYIDDLRREIIAKRDAEGRYNLQILDVTPEVYENFKR